MSKVGEVLDRGTHFYKVVKDLGRGEVVLECSVCSKDIELYPEGSIKGRWGRIKEGKTTPCGCRQQNVYSPYQYKILLKRVFEKDIGYKLLTDISKIDDLKGSSDIEIMDTYTSEIATRKVKSVLREGFKSNIKELEQGIQYYLDSRGIKDKYLSGTEFFRDPLKHKVWYYRCPRCSNDEYVKEGLCSGLFKIDISLLVKGSKACRCTNKFKWSIPQRELQVRKACDERGHRFMKWTDVSKTSSHCRFEWECEQGHTCEMSVDNYRRGKGCKHCAISTGNGYFPSRRNEQDTLYVAKINEDKSNPKNYFKVGRSFEPSRRMNELKREVKKRDCRDIDFYPVIYIFGKHSDIFRLEQEVHDIFKNYKPANGYGSSELIHNSAFLDVLEHLKSTDYPMNISESFYERVNHEINVYKKTGLIHKLFEAVTGFPEETQLKLIKEYFENKIWSRTFSAGATKERIKGNLVDIEQRDFEEK